VLKEDVSLRVTRCHAPKLVFSITLNSYKKSGMLAAVFIISGFPPRIMWDGEERPAASRHVDRFSQSACWRHWIVTRACCLA